MSSYYFSPHKKRSLLRTWFSNLNITTSLIFINVILFILALIAEVILKTYFDTSLMSFLALQANSFFNQGYVWTLLTSMFMHANFIHLFVNMFSLFFLGNFLEMIIGKKRFIWVYLFSGIFAGLFFVLLSYFFGSGLGTRIFASPETYAVGASGAIFAIAGVLAVLTPKNRVYLIAGPLIAIILQVILEIFIKETAILNLLNIIVTVYIIFSIFSIISPFGRMKRWALPLEMPFWILPIVAIVPLVIIGLFLALPIGNMAHLGGVLAGIGYGLYLKFKYKKKTQMIAKYFSK